MTIRLAVRLYGSGKLIHEDRLVVLSEHIDTLIPQLAAEHLERLADHPKHMVEIEFLDEPCLNQRFYRMGTDPSAMVQPLAVTRRSGGKA